MRNWFHHESEGRQRPHFQYCEQEAHKDIHCVSELRADILVIKKQTSVESSIFGSKFVTMKQGCNYPQGICYKLRMVGIPYEGTAYIQGDNQSVLDDTTITDSTLRNKNQFIAYHFFREGADRYEWQTPYAKTHDNEANLVTKLPTSGQNCKGFLRSILHNIFGTAVD